MVDTTITDAVYQAVMFYQGSVNNISFTNMNVNGAQYLWEERVTGNIYAQGVVASNLSKGSAWNCGMCFYIFI